MKVSIPLSILSITLFLQCILSTESVSLEEDLSITEREKGILQKFRELVEARLPHEYMKKEIYLIRWLRAKEFDISAAEQMLLSNLEWRKDNRIDTILEEDFSDVSIDYEYTIDSYEKDGKSGVVAYFDVGNWDLRRDALKGKRDRVTRFFDKYLEEVTAKVRELQEHGQNITQYDFVMNMDGFNLVQNGCLQCISGLTRFILSYESHYPGSARRMILINNPTAFQIILNSVKGALSPLTRNSLQIYGTNKAEWQEKIFADIPKDSLPIDIGGSRQD